MICKKDVISWFKDLESYRRIDMMCTLLNMCLPFELRFLGTCLEELGRRDSQELRGIELRVNNAQDLSSDMLACQKGEPTDKKIRRKMALYLALIRACNRSCVTEIFRTLDEWGKRNFENMTDLDTLQELLLVYTMAANHPVFSFEQHMKCSEIFEKIKSNIFIEDGKVTSEDQLMFQCQSEKNIKTLITSQDVKNHIIPTQQDIISQQRTFRAVNHPGLQIIPSAPLTVLSQSASSFSSTNRSKQLPQSSSPILSQKSSPSTSRGTSPTRTFGNTLAMQPKNEFNQQQLRSITQREYKADHKIRRPSLETNLQLNQHISNEMFSQNTEDVYVNTDGTISQLQVLIRNGFGKNAVQSRSTSGKYLTPAQTSLNQQYQAASHGSFPSNSPSVLSLHNISVKDKIGESKLIEKKTTLNHQSNVESDSGSSNGSYCDTSPRVTPDLIQNSSHSTEFIHLSLESYNTQLNKCVNESSDNILSPSLSSCKVSNAVMFDFSSNFKSSNICSQHQSFGADQAIGSSTSLRQSLIPVNGSGMNANSTNSGIKTVSTSMPASNKVLNAVIMSSPSNVITRGIFGNITSNSLPNQQQYNTSYPYHVLPPQSLNVGSRSTIIPQTVGPSPHIRIPTFQIPTNGDIIYPGFHSSGLAYLSNGPVSMLRSSPSSNINQQLSNAQLSTPLQPKKQQIVTSCNVVQFAASPYTSLHLGGIKPISCYNCGSQNHCGRDCHEASMDDVTRNAVYKLDYTVSSCNVLSATDNKIQPSPPLINPDNVAQNIPKKHNDMSSNEIDIKVISTPTS